MNIELTLSIFFGIGMVEILKAGIGEYFRVKQEEYFKEMMGKLSENAKLKSTTKAKK